MRFGGSWGWPKSRLGLLSILSSWDSERKHTLQNLGECRHFQFSLREILAANQTIELIVEDYLSFQFSLREIREEGLRPDQEGPSGSAFNSLFVRFPRAPQRISSWINLDLKLSILSSWDSRARGLGRPGSRLGLSILSSWDSVIIGAGLFLFGPAIFQFSLREIQSSHSPRDRC